MKFVINCSIFLIFIFCNTQPANAQVNKTDAQGDKQGVWVKYFEGKKTIRYKGEFKDNEPIGKFVYYYPNGKVRAIIAHDENSDSSEAFFYYMNNKMIQHGYYVDDKKVGQWKHYTNTGHLISQATYKDGKLNGEKVIFYKQEVSKRPGVNLILTKINFKDGKKNGEYVSYFPTGKIKEKGVHKNGVKDGVVLRYHPNGNIWIKERWKRQSKHGWWITYDKTGKEEGRRFYLHGTPLEGKELDEYMEKLKSLGKNPNQW